MSVADLFLMRLMREVHSNMFHSVNGAPRSEFAEKAEQKRKTWSIVKAGKASALFGQVQKAIAKRFPHLAVKCIDPVDPENVEAEEEEEEEEEDDDDDDTGDKGSADNDVHNQNPAAAAADADADTAAASAAAERAAAAAAAESDTAAADAESATAAADAESAAAAADDDGGAGSELAGGAGGGASESAAAGAGVPWAVHTPAAPPPGEAAAEHTHSGNHEENQIRNAPSAAAATQAQSPVQLVCKSLKALRFKYTKVIGATPAMVREQIEGHMDKVSEILQNIPLDELSSQDSTCIRKAVLHGLGMYACNKISGVSAGNEIQAAQEAFKQIMLFLLPNAKAPFAFSMHRVTIGDESDLQHPNIWNILSQIIEPWLWAYMYCVLPFFSFTGGIMKAGVSMHHAGVSVPRK